MREPEELAELVKTSPVPEEVLPDLFWLLHKQFVGVMRNHPGHRLEERYASLKAVHDVFRTALNDLNSSLDEFNSLSQDSEYFMRPQQSKLAAMEQSIRKELFAVSTAAHALVEHCRKFKKRFSVPDYDAKRIEIFDTEEHEFVVKLRNALHHQHFIKTDWRIAQRGWGQNATFSSSFELSVDELLAADADFNTEAKSYMRRCGESINTWVLFSSYSQRVERFYSWLYKIYEENLPDNVRDYRKCVQGHHVTHVRAGWRVLLNQVVKPGNIDPYSHLDKYLTSEELNEVLSLPNRSKMQVDRIISLVDDCGACDAEMRETIYRVFRADENAK